jgi:high affinity choline transporter 7
MEIIWVMRVSIIIVGVLATVMALTIPSIYGLWYVSCKENGYFHVYTTQSVISFIV